jgi:hypothetical protein
MNYAEGYQNMQNGAPRKRYHGANVKFFLADGPESQKDGRWVCQQVPSISIQWPGQDETVRKITDQDKEDYPELYAAFEAGNSEYEGTGTPLTHWAMLPGSVAKELAYIGVRTVEQLAEANDSLRGRLGSNWKYVKMSKEWIASANSTQSEVVVLKDELERYKKRSSKLEEQMELLLQRIEASEGTRMTADKILVEEDIDDAPKRRSKRS